MSRGRPRLARAGGRATTGASPRRTRPPRLAQHFLTPPWVTKLVASIQPTADDVFIEIGPGKGALTVPLAATGARVVAIEVDSRLARDLAQRAAGNVRVVPGDVLRVDLAAEIAAERARAGAGARVRVVGNLPYNVSARILFRVLAVDRQLRALADATFMLQREVADRVVANPGSKDYGPVAILTRLQAEAACTLQLPPGAFVPPPRVRSAVVRLRFRPTSLHLEDARLFERMVRVIFQQRRKTLGNALAGFQRQLRGSPAPVAAEAGIDPRRRPETLELDELARLANLFSATP